MEASTIVKLAPTDKLVGISTFDEAFGEHSEFRGRGRARRQARARKRIADRRERHRLRQEARKEQQAARQDRKDIRKTRKLARKAMGDEEEEEPAEDQTEDTTTEDQTQEDDQQTEETVDYGDNGDISEDPEAESFDGDYDSAEGPAKKIDPAIKDITRRITWNHQSVLRHTDSKKKLQDKYQQVGASNKPSKNAMLSQLKALIDKEEMKIQDHQQRISDLKRELKAKHGDHPHISHGYKAANIEYQKAREAKVNADSAKKVQETIVAASLDPSIQPGRIEVPASPIMKTVNMSSADGNGDYDSAEGVKGKMGMSTTTKVVIAVGVAAGLYFLAKKYKVI